ncbi:MAG: hypothetical protein ABII00_16895 [Elusimicrobiota bacterium]
MTGCPPNRRLTAWACALALAALPGTAEAGGDLRQASGAPLLKRALVSLYDLEYVRTRDLALQFIRENPENPFGHLFVAGSVWWEFTTESLTREGRPDLEDIFDKHVLRTVNTAKRLMQSEDKAQRADGYFAAGMVLGLRGQWKVADRRLISAYRDGKKAIKYLKKCLKHDPGYYDAYLGLGLFDYQVAVLPGVLKFAARLLLRGTGDASRGLRRIRLGIDKGRFASRQAAAFLLSLYLLYERDYASAVTLVRDLRRNFPASPYYRFIEIALLNRTGDGVESRRLALELFTDMGRDPAVLRRKQLATVCGVYGPDCLEDSHIRGASTWLTDALANPPDQPPAGWTTLLHLYRALAHDILTERARAVADYHRVLELPDFAGAHEWARLCEESACGREDAFRFLRGTPPEGGRPGARAD